MRIAATTRRRGQIPFKPSSRPTDIYGMDRCLGRTLPRQLLAETPEDRWIQDILNPDADRPTTPEAAARALQEKLIKFGYLGTGKPSPARGHRR